MRNPRAIRDVTMMASVEADFSAQRELGVRRLTAVWEFCLAFAGD
jgi:hypothetical protein